MLENIKALAVVCMLIGLVYRFFKASFCPTLLSEQAFKALTLGWLGVSLALFLSPNFWVFCALVALVAVRVQKIAAPAVTLCGLLYAAPYYNKVIPGLGGINNLVALSYPRVLLFTLLICFLLNNKAKSSKSNNNSTWFDTLVVAQGIFRLALYLANDSVTNSLRHFLYYLLDVAAIYMVGRHWLSNPDQTKACIGAFCHGLLIVCCIAIFEFGKKWLLYTSTAASLDVMGAGEYLTRGGTGLLRTFATAGHSLAFGYIAMVGIVMWLALNQALQRPMKLQVPVLATMVVGIGASLSRGPWMALLASVVLWHALNTNGLVRLLKFLTLAGVVMGLALLTPAGDDIINLIPWVGKADAHNIDYRERLVLVSYFVIMQSPWFGSTTFMQEPVMQQLIQGQGIIDLVNTYVAIALSTGFVGVGFFLLLLLGPAVWAVRLVLSSAAKVALTDTPDRYFKTAMLRGVACALIGTIIALAATSSISVIPWTVWLIVGLCVGMCRNGLHPLKLTAASRGQRHV